MVISLLSRILRTNLLYGSWRVGRNRISFRHTDIWDRLIDDLLDLNRRYSDVYRCAHHHAILVDCLAGKDGRHLHHAALIRYFDEVKYHKGRQPYYWLGGITVDAELIKTLEEQLNSLAEEVFGVRTSPLVWSDPTSKARHSCTSSSELIAT